MYQRIHDKVQNTVIAGTQLNRYPINKDVSRSQCYNYSLFQCLSLPKIINETIKISILNMKLTKKPLAFKSW